MTGLPGRTTVVTVTYNSAAVVGGMLASLPAGTAVVACDNASQDNSADICRQHGARVVALPVNKGFGNACNAGAAEASSEFLFFLNPDAQCSAGCIKALEAAADLYPKASAFNPRIENASGRSFFKRSSRLLPRSRWMERGWPMSDCVVPVLSGAALFVRRAAFEQVGGFDAKIFLYHEDDDLSLRLAAAAGPLMFIDRALVRHVEGTGSPRSAEIAALKAYHMARSQVYAMRKHGVPLAGLRAKTSAAMKLFSPAVLFSARKRAQALAFFKGTLSAKSLR